MSDQVPPVLEDGVTGGALHLGQPHLLQVLQQLRPGQKRCTALAALPTLPRGRQRVLIYVQGKTYRYASQRLSAGPNGILYVQDKTYASQRPSAGPNICTR